MKTPAHYSAPLRSRAAIITWIDSTFSHRGGYNYDHRNWLVCQSVKTHNCDLSFDHLLDVAAERGDITVHKGDPVWEVAARATYDDSGESQLWDWAIEDARRTFNGRKGEHYHIPDDDGFNALYDGTPVDVEFAFLGRSGGWLVLTHFDGHELSGDGEVLTEMPLPTLRRLYRYLVMLRADLTRPGLTPSDRVEDAAAWLVFVNLCDDGGDSLPTSESVAKESAERAEWEARDTVTV